MTTRFFSWFFVVVWAALIFLLSSIPSLNSGLGVWDLILRKLAHIVVFGILTGFLIRAFRRTWPDLPARKIIIWSFTLAFLYALSDEIHQGFVPGRTCSAMDVGFDTLGILMTNGAFLIMKQKFIKLFLLCLAVLVVGCGPQSQFNKAMKLEKEGRFSEAWKRYQEFVAHHPNDPLAAEALFRAGWVTQKGLNDFFAAQIYYEKVTTEYPQSKPWAQAAALQIINCPDYFPLIPGSEWEEGDSDTKGSIAKTVTRCLSLKNTKKTLPSEAAILKRSFYGGSKKFQTSSYVYRKSNKELKEYVSENDSRSKTILKWPLTIGQKWRTPMGGRFFVYELVGIKEKIKVAAGEFEGCLKVKSSIEGSPGKRFEYYAPGVGRILTTLSSSHGEKRNTELISYKIAAFPGFGSRDPSP
ncbi:hypothetical protein BVX98_00755 [bacterium F11]|nr:hypothetical protein BVX98_00755 [bacterium F11]